MIYEPSGDALTCCSSCGSIRPANQLLPLEVLCEGDIVGQCPDCSAECRAVPIVAQVCDALCELGYNATYEYPGFILVAGESFDVVYTLGDLNDTWDGNACDAIDLNPHNDSYLDTGIPRESTDVVAIADAFHQLLKKERVS
jgi:hypothetical protein